MDAQQTEDGPLDQMVVARLSASDLARLDSWVSARGIRSRSAAVRDILLSALSDGLAQGVGEQHGQAIGTIKDLIRRVSGDAVAEALGKGGQSGRGMASRYANGRRSLTLAQAAKLRRAFPELDLNQAAEALLQIEEERAAEEGTES